MGKRRFAMARERSRANEISKSPKASFRQLLPYLLQHKRVLYSVIALSALGSFATLAQPIIVSQVILAVQTSQPLQMLVWTLVLLVILSAVLSGFRQYLLQRTGEGVVLSSRMALVKKMLHLPIKEFDQRRTGDLVSRLGSDTTLLRAVLTQGLLEAVGGALTLIGAAAAMVYLDALLFLITAAVVTLAVLAVVIVSRRIRVASRRAQDKVGDLAASAERAITSIRTVRASNATNRELEGVQQAAVDAWKLGLKVAKISALVVPVSGIALQVAFLSVLGVGGLRVASGALPIADLVAFILFLFIMILPLGQAFGAVSSVNQALGALSRIQEVVSLPSETDSDLKISGDELVSIDDFAIELNSISFRYPPKTVIGNDPFETKGGLNSAFQGTKSSEISANLSESELVLRDISLQVPTGSRTAIVGPSGAGKSTILALIERFYEPESGEIKIFGNDIRSVSRKSLRATIGYVEQNSPALAGTIRDNLLLGCPTASEEDMLSVLGEVNLTTVLERDKKALDAQIGEAGVLLSGGERQRLAIARVLLQAPQILLLDESTSSLDGPNELLMRAAIERVSIKRTVIVIAHRLATVVDSDQIVVMRGGQVEAVGDHKKLLKTSSLYRDLAENQLLD